MVQLALLVCFCQLVSLSRVPKLVSNFCIVHVAKISHKEKLLIVGITAGEAKNPTKTIPRAIRNTFWRIIIFYICTILLIGMCVPYDYPDLENSEGGPGTASFTLVFKLAGIEAGAHVINAIVLTSVLSACNSSMYTTSRTLMGLSRDNNAPAFLGRVNRYGAPFW